MKFKTSLALAALLAWAVFLLAAWQAQAHSWYSPYCCNEKDCKELLPTEVTEDADQYIVIINGKTVYEIPKDSKVIKPSQDGNYHICLSAVDMSVRCFYVPLAT
jgi:hypothetical protein